jgi:hypothetical protein
MINRDFRPGAPIRNFVKDLDTVLATAKQIGLPQLPIVKAVRDVFKALYDQGHERSRRPVVRRGSRTFAARGRRARAHRIVRSPRIRSPTTS